ncbi:hypothetical protein KC347_g296 [Hortaea werneckii]|nr:hypothetical protein KC347_g296 [Hortaea werneckii]
MGTRHRNCLGGSRVGMGAPSRCCTEGEESNVLSRTKEPDIGVESTSRSRKRIDSTTRYPTIPGEEHRYPDLRRTITKYAGSTRASDDSIRSVPSGTPSTTPISAHPMERTRSNTGPRECHRHRSDTLEIPRQLSPVCLPQRSSTQDGLSSSPLTLQPVREQLNIRQIAATDHHVDSREIGQQISIVQESDSTAAICLDSLASTFRLSIRFSVFICQKWHTTNCIDPHPQSHASNSNPIFHNRLRAIVIFAPEVLALKPFKSRLEYIRANKLVRLGGVFQCTRLRCCGVGHGIAAYILGHAEDLLSLCSRTVSESVNLQCNLCVPDAVQVVVSVVELDLDLIAAAVERFGVKGLVEVAYEVQEELEGLVASRSRLPLSSSQSREKFTLHVSGGLSFASILNQYPTRILSAHTAASETSKCSEGLISPSKSCAAASVK